MAEKKSNKVLAVTQKLMYEDVICNLLDEPIIDYKEDAEVEEFKKERGLTIVGVDAKSIPQQVNDNCIYYSYDNNKPVSLFHHLRNAFAHRRIIIGGECMELKDMKNVGKKNETVTMIGKIKFDDLVDYCNLFIEQKRKFIETEEAKKQAKV